MTKSSSYVPPAATARATARPPHSNAESVPYDKLIPSLRVPVAIPLGRLEMTIFSRVNGHRSVADIAQEVGLTPFEVLRLLERLAGLVPDLRIGEAEVVELSVDDLWEEEVSSVHEERTQEVKPQRDGRRA